MKLRGILKNHPDMLGRDRFNRLLRSHGLMLKRPRGYRKTTNSDHPYYKYPNLLKEAEVSAPMQVWVSDITYVRIGKRHAYLSLVTDHYSKKIVGAVLAPTLESKHTVRALEEAISREGAPQMHHSDRGIQYCCHEYTGILERNNVQISMTQTGDPLDNAVAERVNGIIKNEYVYPYLKRYGYQSDLLRKVIQAYNNLRPHMSCGMKTPKQTHEMTTITRKKVMC